MIDLLMNIGTIAIVVATLPGIRAAYKNRDSLKGYSVYQAMLMIIAASSFLIAFWLMGNMVSMLAQLPPLAFWSYVASRVMISKRVGK